MKNHNMNSRGQMSPGVMLLVVLGVVALIGVIVVSTGVLQTQAPGTTQELADKELADCENAPTLTINARNSNNIGTAATGVTYNYSRNGEFVGSLVSGTTELLRGSEVVPIAEAANFIAVVMDPVTITCGDNPQSVDLYATSTNTFRLFNSDNDLVTDSESTSAAGTNQSSSAASITMDLRIDSTTDESTGDLIIVIEHDNTTEVDQIKLSGFGGVTDATTPDFYAPNAAGSIVEAFNVPAVKDGDSVQGTLVFTPETGETIGAAQGIVFITAYSKQAFVDTNGDFVVGVEDTDGTIKYEDTWDFDFRLG